MGGPPTFGAYVRCFLFINWVVVYTFRSIGGMYNAIMPSPML